MNIILDLIPSYAVISDEGIIFIFLRKILSNYFVYTAQTT